MSISLMASGSIRSILRGEPWAKIPRGSATDADNAAKAVDGAMWGRPWAEMMASTRGKVMRKLGDLVAANA
jgi:aldehyde dehydrogenase (NAD+)